MVVAREGSRLGTYCLWERRFPGLSAKAGCRWLVPVHESRVGNL
jgi:hypothetical protein